MTVCTFIGTVGPIILLKGVGALMYALAGIIRLTAEVRSVTDESR